MAQGPQDQPDYIRFAQQAAVPIVNQALDISSGLPISLGPFYVGNTPTILLELTPAVTTHLASVQLRFSDVSTVDPNSLTWDGLVATSSPLRALVPVSGNFVRVQIVPFGGAIVAAAIQARMVGVGITSPRSTQLAGFADMAEAVDAAVAGGGGNRTHNLPRTLPGQYRFYVANPGSGLAYNIQQQYADGVWTVIASGQSAGSQAAEIVNLGPAPTRYVVVNTGAGAQDLSSSLISVS